MVYKNIPVKEDTFQRLLKVVINKESWDATINRLIDEWSMNHGRIVHE